MAFTYATLIQALQDYIEDDDDTLVSNLPIIVQQAEDRILKTLQLPIFRKTLSDTLTASSEYYTFPTDMLSSYSLAVNNSGYEFLIFKEESFLREAYPLSSVEDAPRYYSNFDGEKFILAPTPDQNYTIELNYFYKPESIVTASTSWLGTNAESCLLYGCLLEAYTFLLGDADMMQVYSTRYEDALGKLRLLGEGRMATDNFRNG